MDAQQAQQLAFGLIAYVMLLFSLSVHECSHGWVAARHGDDTAERDGRVTLNPTVHIDPIGTILIPGIMWMLNGTPLFGWAKPTPVHTGNLHPLRAGILRTWGAGPLSNLALALLFSLILFILIRTGGVTSNADFALTVLVIGIQINVLLAVFNLLPIPPLDGSWVLSWGLPRELGARYDKLVEPLGGWLLLLLFIPLSHFVVHPITQFITSLLFRLIG